MPRKKKQPKWPADKVERWPIEKLTPQANNARTHTNEQIAQIAGSMKEWGWTNPILIDEGGSIIAGHGRVMAARLLDIDSIPAIVAKGWTKAQIKAYALADNQLAMNAAWDVDMLRVELQGLDDLDFDLGLIGFPDLEALMADTTSGLTDPDDAPAPPEVPVTVSGDLWICGNHRILCGDSTVETDVSRLLNGVKPHLMVTDPPYGVEYDPTWRKEAGLIKKDTKEGSGRVPNDDRVDWSDAWSLFPGDVAYIWHADRHASQVQRSIESCGFVIRCQIIWNKGKVAIGRGDYHWQHEPCWYAVKKNSKGHWGGSRDQWTVWDIRREKEGRTEHGTQKPVECMRRPIVNNSSVGQAVYEPFCGSGTTMIAAEMEGRHAYCIESSEAYCDVIVKRWQAFTGQKATHEDGRAFDEIEAERQPKAA